MKTNKFLKLISVFTMLLFITSCVEDSDFELPNTTITEPDLEGYTKINFSALIDRYNDAVDAGDGVGVFETDEAKVYIEAYVVSSDQGGNFFEELIIQNNIDGGDSSVDGNDVRRGIRVEANVRSLSDTFEFGRKIVIKLNGLAIGENHGTYVIGKSSGSDIDQIQEYEYLDFIGRFSEVATITPKTVAIGELTDLDENTLVQFEDVQFVRGHIFPTTATFAGAATDQFDGFRTIESCEDGGSIALQTSTFADFKSLLLPQNRGAIQGVFTRDFGDDLNVLVINTPNDIQFDNENRCDPDILECPGSTSTDVTIFNEPFDIGDESDLDALGWTNVNVSGGSERYEDNSFNNDTYMKISAFGTGESPLEAWLVTPTINLDGTNEEELTFNVSSNFETGQILTVFISENYTGDPTTTEWTQLDADIPIGDGGFGDFVARAINISCLNGDVNIAFKYLGNAGSQETRYHIDDVKVTGSN